MFQKLALGLAIIIALGLVYRYAIYPWYERWGASQAEIAMNMPGDDLVPGSAATSTVSCGSNEL